MRVQWSLPAFLLAVASITAPWPAMAAPPFAGRWQKDFIVDKGVRNQDPRWELAVHFGQDGKFSYRSRNTTEIRLSNGDTRPMVDEIDIAGTWSAGKDGRIVIEFDRPPVGPEISTLAANLGYDRKLGKAIVTLDFDGKLMRLNGVGRDRQLFFRKAI